MLNRKTTFCVVCGLDQGYTIWGEDGKSPTFGICPCCGAEFGYNDFTLEGIRQARKKWISGGSKWCFPEEIPEGWDWQKQLENIPSEFK